MFQDKQGGVFRWVGEAYGKKLGFLAIWVQSVSYTHLDVHKRQLLENRSRQPALGLRT